MDSPTLTAGPPQRARRAADAALRHSASTSSSSVNSSTELGSTESLGFGNGQGGRLRFEGKTLAALLDTLPSSPKELLQRIDRQRDELRLLQEENMRLKARELDVSSLTLRLQERLSGTQQQVDRIKTQVHLELENPISEEEYNTIEALPEPQRDLIDTIKLGIFRRVGSLRASTEAATRRAAELSGTVSTLTQDNVELKMRVKELEAQHDDASSGAREKIRKLEKEAARVIELEATARDLEGRLKGVYVDQEQYLTAKMTAQMKTEEVARLSVRLEESEMQVERYKANAECNEQKLDILKSEYYELRLKNSQRVLELESALRASEEKLKALGDLEMESELFISNLATQSGSSFTLGVGGEVGGAGSASAGAGNSAHESWLAVPRSRKLAHTLVVTKRCLHLENKVASLERDCEFKDKQIQRLQVSLDVARDALNNINSPYSLVEKTLEDLGNENGALREKVQILSEDNRHLKERLEQRTSEVTVLCRHRAELLRMKKMLRRLGLEEGYAFPDPESPTAAKVITNQATDSPSSKSPLNATVSGAKGSPNGAALSAIEICS